MKYRNEIQKKKMYWLWWAEILMEAMRQYTHRTCKSCTIIPSKSVLEKLRNINEPQTYFRLNSKFFRINLKRKKTKNRVANTPAITFQGITQKVSV